MARELIKVAHSNGDTSIPGDRYKLCYGQAFGISSADFGADRGEHPVYRISVSGVSRQGNHRLAG
jgi:hypothetical protein